MSGAPVSFDRIIPEETQGPMPVEAPTTLASGSMDSFQHVEAVLKEDNVSTGTLDSQDWEMAFCRASMSSILMVQGTSAKMKVGDEVPLPKTFHLCVVCSTTMSSIGAASAEGTAAAEATPSGREGASTPSPVDSRPQLHLLHSCHHLVNGVLQIGRVIP